MASLFIKSNEAADLAAELAAELKTTKTEVVLDALRRRKAELHPLSAKPSLREWLAEFRKKNPLPPPTGLKADKAFYDWLSGEEDVPNVPES